MATLWAASILERGYPYSRSIEITGNVLETWELALALSKASQLSPSYPFLERVSKMASADLAAAPSAVKAAADLARLTARVELLHPSKQKPGLLGDPVVPFPKPIFETRSSKC